MISTSHQAVTKLNGIELNLRCVKMLIQLLYSSNSYIRGPIFLLTEHLIMIVSPLNLWARRKSDTSNSHALCL